MPTIRDEVLHSQLRPVVALALAAATAIALMIVGQYAWLRLQALNPLDEIEPVELAQVLRVATPEQWPVLVRWVAVHGLGMTVDGEHAAPVGYARLPDGRQVALSDVLSIVVAGEQVDPVDGRLLGPVPPLRQVAIAQLAQGDAMRLARPVDGDPSVPQHWPALLLRLDGDRVAVLASPDYRLATREVVEVVLKAFMLTAAVVAGFVALFLVAFQRRFAARSAQRLSAPVERLARAVRLAATEGDASRRVDVEAPAEVGQLAADFNLMQEHLARALTERQRVIDGQRDLVASLSHELRTPLTVLRGHAELLLREGRGADRAEVMLRQVEDLHVLLSDLLDMSRLESIEAGLAIADVPLSPLIEEMVERFGAAAWRQGVLLRPAETANASLVVRADPLWLRQIVANLLSNAIRHTPQGGLVTLGMECEGMHVHLTVEDTGAGFGADGLRRDVAARPAGIGLQVVRRLARAMQGSLRLDVTDAGGARAILALPEALGQGRP
jgi:signal transduction histidine kinase